MAFSLALGAIWFGQHRAAEKTSAELEQAFGELDAAIEATLQAEERVEAALAELDREAGRYGGVSFDALDMEMDAAETMVLAHLVLTDAYRAIRHVEKPGVTDRALIGEARDAVEALEQQIPVLDELAEEIKEVTAELSRE